MCKRMVPSDGGRVFVDVPSLVILDPRHGFPVVVPENKD